MDKLMRAMELVRKQMEEDFARMARERNKEDTGAESANTAPVNSSGSDTAGVTPNTPPVDEPDFEEFDLDDFEEENFDNSEEDFYTSEEESEYDDSEEDFEEDEDTRFYEEMAKAQQSMAEEVQAMSNPNVQTNPIDDVENKEVSAEESFHSAEGYAESEEDMKPASVDDVQDISNPVNKNEHTFNLDDIANKHIDDLAKAIMSCKKTATKEITKPYKPIPIEYKKDTYSFGNMEKEIKKTQRAIEWGTYLNNVKRHGEDNYLEYLRQCITSEIINIFKGRDNIHSIVVSDQRLIINDILVELPVSAIPENVINTFSPDVECLFYENKFAPLFDYLDLAFMSRLDTLMIDSVSFAYGVVASDLDLPRNAKPKHFKKAIPSLKMLELGTRSFEETADEETKVSAPKNSRSAHTDTGAWARFQRNRNLTRGFQLHACEGSDSFRKWCTKNLTNYANNRKDKGFLRYSGGILTRGIMALGATGISAVTHITAGVYNTVKDVITDARGE